MTTQPSYDDALKEDLGALIDAVELPDLHKRFLRLRWLDQMLWAEKRAGQARDRYYVLRMLAIVGGVIVPAMVSLNQTSLGVVIGWITFGLSLAVAISLAVEGFFRWGERWTHYRRMAELLKSEGWMFFQLAGPYQAPGGHAAAYPEFAKRVEAIVASDVDVFIAQVAREKTKQGESSNNAAAGKS